MLNKAKQIKKKNMDNDNLTKKQYLLGQFNFWSMKVILSKQIYFYDKSVWHYFLDGEKDVDADGGQLGQVEGQAQPAEKY